MSAQACFLQSSRLSHAVAHALGCAALLLPAAALAQAPGVLSPGVQLQEQLRQFENSPAPGTGDVEFIPSRDDQDDSEAQGSEQTMFLKGIRFEGNFKYDSDELIQPFLGLIGEEISFAELQQAVVQAQNVYRSAGYITSVVYLPQQNFVDNGMVLVRVVEGFIEDVEVRGANDGLRAYAERMLQRVEGGPNKNIFNFSQLERQLVLMRDFGGLQYTTTLARGTRLGGSVLLVDLKEKTLSAGLTADNNLPAQLGEVRTGAYAQYVTPTSLPFKINLLGNYAFPVENGLIDGIASLSAPIGTDGLRATALWAISSTNSSDLYDGPSKVQTRGESNYVAFGMDYPLIARRNTQLNIGLKGTGQNSSNDIYVDDKQTTNLSTNRIRAARFNLDAFTFDAETTYQLNLLVSQGFGGLDDELEDGEFLSTPYGSNEYTTARLNLSVVRRIFDSNTSITLKGAGQWASTGLPVPEQFTYGGPNFGRGFTSAYILGDQGASGLAQLGHDFYFENGTASLGPFAWIDYGYVNYLEGPLPDQAAATYGVGLKGSAWSGKGNFEVGWGVPALNTFNPRDVGVDSGIVYFKVGVGF